MLLEFGGQARTLGVLDGGEVLDTHGVEHLTTETLGGNTCANALA